MDINAIVKSIQPTQIYGIKYEKYIGESAQYFIDTSVANIVDLYFSTLTDFYSDQFCDSVYDSDIRADNKLKNIVLNCGTDMLSRIDCIKIFVDRRPISIVFLMVDQNDALVEMEKHEIYWLLDDATYLHKKMDQSSIIANIVAQYARPRLYFLIWTDHPTVIVSSSTKKIIECCYDVVDWDEEYYSEGDTEINGVSIDRQKELLRAHIFGDDNRVVEHIALNYVGANHRPKKMNDADKLELLLS